MNYEPTPEGKLWHCVLLTYYIDAASKGVHGQEWKVILEQANSHWTKTICQMIDLNHDFFIEKLLKIRANRFSINTSYSVYVGLQRKHGR